MMIEGREGVPSSASSKALLSGGKKVSLCQPFVRCVQQARVGTIHHPEEAAEQRRSRRAAS